MTITQRIDAVLKEKGKSRRQVALKAEIPPSTFQSAMERGSMSFSMVDAVANALEISVVELLGYSLKHDTPENREIAAKGLHTALTVMESFKDRDPNEDATIEELIEELEAHKNEPKDLDLLVAYRKLNIEGQKIAIERVQELTEIPKYQKNEKAPEAQ